MNYKTGVHGKEGRMGKEVLALLTPFFSYENDRLELSLTEEADVWVDFSSPEGTLCLLENVKVPVVICTTGFSSAQLEKIEIYSKNIPVLLSANTSPGINTILSMLEVLPKLSNLGFEVVVDESHHKDKKDAPSGTAKALANTLKETGNEPKEIHSIRSGGEKGRHKITFIGQEEEFTIEHRVFDRAVFARGALLAAHFLVNQKPGLYSMKDVWRNNNV